jgi:nicotinamide riboside kinase
MDGENGVARFKKMHKPLRIAMIGPESSGKTSLAKLLSAEFGFALVEEYAREYLTSLGRSYELDDIQSIYQKQMLIEQEVLGTGVKGIISDTEYINGLVWCEEKYGVRPSWFVDVIQKQPYNMYLLTSPDLPWVPDPLRENPGNGEYLFERYKQELERINAIYVVVDGVGEARLNKAQKAIIQLMSHQQ